MRQELQASQELVVELDQLVYLEQLEIPAWQDLLVKPVSKDHKEIQEHRALLVHLVPGATLGHRAPQDCLVLLGQQGIQVHQAVWVHKVQREHRDWQVPLGTLDHQVLLDSQELLVRLDLRVRKGKLASQESQYWDNKELKDFKG